MILEPAGIFVLERLDPLTPALFDELLARAEPFVLTMDFRGLEPPVEELDRVRLQPATVAGLPTGTLILRRVGEGFTLERVTPDSRNSARDERVAQVGRVERPGRSHDLGSFRWRLTGALLVGLPGFRAVHDRGSRLARFAGKILAPFPCPVNLGPPDRLAQGVVAKYANPADFGHQVKLAEGGLEEWEAQVFERVIPSASRVLVVGCGAGREAVPLAKRGHRVVGVDPVPTLVDAARRLAAIESADVEFQVASAHALQLPPASFDVALCSSAVYQQIPTRRRRIDVLRRLADVLTPHGVIILCAGWHPTRGPRLAFVDGLRWGLRRLFGERFATEPGDRLIRFLSLASDAWQPCFYHAFRGPEEIDAEIAAAGLTYVIDPDGPWLVRRPA